MCLRKGERKECGIAVHAHAAQNFKGCPFLVEHVGFASKACCHQQIKEWGPWALCCPCFCSWVSINVHYVRHEAVARVQSIPICRAFLGGRGHAEAVSPLLARLK